MNRHFLAQATTSGDNPARFALLKFTPEQIENLIEIEHIHKSARTELKNFSVMIPGGVVVTAFTDIDYNLIGTQVPNEDFEFECISEKLYFKILETQKSNIYATEHHSIGTGLYHEKDEKCFRFQIQYYGKHCGTEFDVQSFTIPQINLEYTDEDRTAEPVIKAQQTCNVIALKCDKTVKNKYCSYIGKCKYQEYLEEMGVFKCQLTD